MKVIRLVPDTNLFIQCRSLNELPWGEAFAAYDVVRLIVTRPLQREIDNQKNRGNDRVGRRARRAHGLLRKQILAEAPYVIRERSPRVVLEMRLDIRVRQGALPDLDLQEFDDQLVACGLALLAEKSDDDVCVLSHDGGPLATAKQVGLGIWPIPDTWLRPPEPSAEEAKIKKLEQEVQRLARAEPIVGLACLDTDGNSTDCLEFVCTTFSPLQPDAIDRLMARLQSLIPIASEFGPKERTVRRASDLLHELQGTRWRPATEDEIREYREMEYPQWLDKCRKAFEGLHDRLTEEAAPQEFLVRAENSGSRPATSVLIEFDVSGDLLIAPPPYREESAELTVIELPCPPAAPQGEWHTKHSLASMIDTFRRPTYAPLIANLPRLHKKERDPNEWYYHPERSEEPARSFALSCAQWRHGRESELFYGEIYGVGSNAVCRGALTCRLHAENISKPVEMKVPVRLQLEFGDTFAEAASMIEKLQNKP